MSKLIIKNKEKIKNLQGGFVYFNGDKALMLNNNASFFFCDGKADKGWIFEKCVSDFISVCNSEENKPVIAYFNGQDNFDQFDKELSKDFVRFYSDDKEGVEHETNGEGGFNKYLLSGEKPAVMQGTKDKLYKIFDDILSVRSVMYPNYKNNCYIILDKLEEFDFDAKRLIEMLRLCYPRKICLIIRIKSKDKFVEKYSQDAYNCVKYVCSAFITWEYGYQNIGVRNNNKWAAYNLESGKPVKPEK